MYRTGNIVILILHIVEKCDDEFIYGTDTFGRDEIGHIGWISGLGCGIVVD